MVVENLWQGRATRYALSALRFSITAYALVFCFDGIAHSSELSATGRWGTLLANGFYICKDRESAWTWTNASEFPKAVADGATGTPQQTTIAIINSNGTVLRSWQLASELDSMGVTGDCKVAWAVDVDRQKLFWVDRDGDAPVGLAPGTTLAEGVSNLVIGEDHQHAWVRFSSYRPVASLERTPQGIVATEIQDGPATAGESSVQGGFGGERIAIVPESRGLMIADRHHTWRVANLTHVDVASVYPAQAGHVLWVVPQKEGLFVIDDQGNPVQFQNESNLLKHEDVQEILAGPNTTNETLTTDYAWVRTVDRNLYVFKTSADAIGRRTVIPLNGGKPIAEPHGGPTLHVDAIKWVGDGSTIWVETTAASWSPHVTGIWHISVNVDGRVDCTHLDPQLYESKPVRWVFADYPRPDMIWVRASDYVLYEIDYVNHTTTKDPFKGPLVQNIFSTNRRDRLWIVTASGDYLLGPATDLLKITDINFDGQSIGQKDGAFHSQLGTGPTTVTINMPNVVPARPRYVTLSVRKQGFAGSDEDVVANGSGKVDERGQAHLEMFVRNKMTPLSLYDVDVTYGDQLFFNTKLTWSGISLSLPWYEWPYALALLLLVGPTVLFVVSLQQLPKLQRWVPIAVPMVAAIAAKVNVGPSQVSFQEIIATALLAFFIVFLAALFSPVLFRTIASVHPYRALVPSVLQISAVRRRFFQSYLRDLARAVERIRVSALDEAYYPVPTRVQDSSESPHSRQNVMSSETIALLTTARDSDIRSNVLIEAPGGRGKSALLNELVCRAIRQFELDPQSPLPVLGTLCGKTLDDAISAALGRFRIAEDLVTGHLFVGDIVLFVDGLSESGQDPILLEAHFSTPGVGERIRICATSRPIEAWRKAFSVADRWIVICPERLTDQNIEQFVASYLNEPVGSSGAGTVSSKGPESIQGIGAPENQNGLERWRVARAADGTYLPLLVRFAMLASNPVDSVADLYRTTLNRLLARANSPQEMDALRQSAEQLAVESYWHTGERVLEYERNSARDTQFVQRLLEVGVLIDADATQSRIRSQPKLVRFIHDSMQSYLVASALNTLHDWSVLARAAGAPEFARAGSDLMAGDSSELFDMCLHVFKPTGEVRKWLSDALLDLASAHGPALSIDQVRRTLVGRDSIAVRATDPREMTTRTYLTKLVKDAMTESDQGMDLLGRLYGSLQRHVWNLQHSMESDDSEDEIVLQG